MNAAMCLSIVYTQPSTVCASILKILMCRTNDDISPLSVIYSIGVIIVFMYMCCVYRLHVVWQYWCVCMQSCCDEDLVVFITLCLCTREISSRTKKLRLLPLITQNIAPNVLSILIYKFQNSEIAM